MVLVSLLPGGEGVWLSKSSSLSPLFLSTLFSFILLKSTCMSHRFLQFLLSLLILQSFLELFNSSLPSFTVLGVVALSTLAHLPAFNSRNTYIFLAGFGFYALACLIGAESDALVVFFLVTLTALGWKAYVLAITVAASTPTPLVFPIVSHFMPRYYFTKSQFFRADNPPEEVAQLRERSFDKMKLHWDAKWAKSLQVSEYLRTSFSDLRFAGSSRVFIPFAKVLDDWCDPCTVITKADKTDLIDIDGHRLIDVSGSYGVNVCGYEKYKEFMGKGWDLVKDVGCVLGPIHPILKENIQMLKQIAKKEEISFHMSGTEAVMCAVRLARFNTEKELVVVFGGAYHGWWDGVQPMAGNERVPNDILTLKDLDPLSLKVLALRKNEIAAVVINPLQGFHPNSPPPSDLVLASNSRKAGGVSSSTQKYKDWLINLRKLCNELDIVLIFDEVYTGFRLAPGGAQEYFDVVADMVVYGKTLGGGFPNGIVCGPRNLMARNDPKKPLRVAYVIGTFAAHPLLLGAMNQFLKFLTDKDTVNQYNALRERTVDWVAETNEILAKECPIEGYGAPIQLASYSSVWTMLYKIPGRYHWMLQYYLKDEGVNLSWVGTGRLSFSLDFDNKKLVELREKIIKACKKMKADGWWYIPEGENERVIQLSLAKELGMALFKRIIGA